MLRGPILGVEGLGRRVDERWLWRGLDLQLAAGDRLGVAGPAGVGKSLLLRALAALDPIDEGRLVFDGAPIEARDVPAYRAAVVYLHQRPAVFPGTVARALERPFSLGIHRDKRFDRACAASLLHDAGMPERLLETSTHDLSGGEAQIVALVRALLLAPRVLLFDEPTSSLDAQRITRVEALIDKWMTDDARRACVWVSHTHDQLERVTTRRIEISGAAP